MQGKVQAKDEEGEKIQINEEQLENQIALLEANTEAAKVYKEKYKKSVLTNKRDSVIIKSIQQRYNKHTSQKDI